MPKNSIGEFIAILRKSNGYTQQEVADRLGVSNKTVSSWETGASCPDIAMLPAIAELFGVTCDELLRGERIAAGESAEVSQKKHDKALSFQMARYKNNVSVTAAVSYGLIAAGVLLTLILAFAALRSRLGFWLGLVLLLAAILTAVIACRRLQAITAVRMAASSSTSPSQNPSRLRSAANAKIRVSSTPAAISP